MTLKHRLNVLPIIADCILYFESDENRSSHREELNLLFRLNFYTMQFSMFAFHLTWNSFILPNSSSFVNNFFQVFQNYFQAWRRRFRQLLYITKPFALCQPLFSDFVVESSDSVVLFDTALSIYQIIPALSTGFLQIFWYFSFLFDNFRKLNKSL